MYGKAAFLLILTLGATPALAEKTIEPGYWESTSTTTFIITTAPKTEHRCITPEQVNTYLTAPETGHYKCAYSRKSVHGGVADLSGQCHDKHGRTFDVEVHGTYAPEHFRMKASFALPKLPIGGSATTEARRISATCPSQERP